MKKLIIGALVATVVTFFLGFLFWGIPSTYEKLTQRTTDNEVAMRALSELFTDSGVYFVPDSVGRDEKDEKAAMELAAKGPVAIIYYDADGTDYSWTLYVKGLVHFFVTALLLGLLMRSVPASLGGFANGAKFGGMIGLIAALFIQGGNLVWWGMGTSWLLYSLIYDIVVFTVAGGLLGQFMKPSSSAEA